ncbi:MAG: aldo/keto reductase [Candidatus Heimdallarchaeaceae archaeon]
MFATEEGTNLYKEQAISGKNIHPQHFREVFNLHLSSIGLGTYLGQPTEEDDIKVRNAVKTCIKSGAINVIDTAINYRNQRAEREIGNALQELISEEAITREQIFISTKNGYIAPSEEKYYGKLNEYIFEELIHRYVCRKEDIVGGIHSMSPSFLEFQLEQSLKNLRVSTIDLLYLHNAAESQLDYVTPSEFYDKLEAAFSFFERMRDINKIRWYGLATWDSLRVQDKHPHYLQLEKVVDIAKKVGGDNHGFRFIQVPLNFIYHQAVSLKNQYIENTKYSLAEAAKQFDLYLFTSVPLLQGQVFKSTVQPKFALLMTKAQQAIQYSRSAHTRIVSTLVGMKEEEHIKENLKVATVPPATQEELESAFS